MKTMRRTMTLLVAILFCTPLISAQNLSEYMNFSLGTNLIQLAKQVDEKTGGCQRDPSASGVDSGVDVVAGAILSIS